MIYKQTLGEMVPDPSTRHRFYARVTTILDPLPAVNNGPLEQAGGKTRS